MERKPRGVAEGKKEKKRKGGGAGGKGGKRETNQKRREEGSDESKREERMGKEGKERHPTWIPFSTRVLTRLRSRSLFFFRRNFGPFSGELRPFIITIHHPVSSSSFYTEDRLGFGLLSRRTEPWVPGTPRR
ncbi:hypothetical protein ACFXTH_040810 [Malus domestica]